jgi:pathogenesis-related protein 1
MKLFLCLLLLLSQYCRSQEIALNTGSNIKPNEAKLFLDHHNKIRAIVGTAALIWNPKLSTYAQSWADYLVKNKECKLIHSKCIDNEGLELGENIYWGSDATLFSPLDASKSWYKEKLNYTYQPIGDSKINKTGHYTQMVWKNTREVGVGISYCKDGGIMIVASYYPAGNYIGEYPY